MKLVPNSLDASVDNMSKVTVNRYYDYPADRPQEGGVSRWRYKVELASFDTEENPPAKTPEECVSQLVTKLRKLADDLDEGLKNP
jgi:hypothetical protein